MQDIADKLLGGAERVSTRKRGFVEWTPRTKTLLLLAQVQAILTEYADYLPLTIRQIFYRLIGAHGLDKSQQSYDRLCEVLNNARRARIIPMDVIRDDGGTLSIPNFWRDADEFLAAVRRQAATLKLDRSEGQERRLAVFCEAGGMVPQLARVANPYGVSVISSGGFESVTEKYNFAVQVAEEERETEVLHIGDHDPSGVHLFLSLAEDVQAFADELGGTVEFTRLAVTPEQIERYQLPTALPKKGTHGGSNIAFRGTTCQAEALAPDDLANIVRQAIASRVDEDVLERVLKREKRERAKLRRILG